jgi:hexosaminidase
VNTLRSTFDPTTRSITLELDLSESLPADGRLALTSIVQLTPSADSTARLMRQMASYHELWPVRDLASGETWTIADLQLSHSPNHANDGPVSAFLIRPDDSTSTVQVEPMRRAGDPQAIVSDPRQILPGDRSHGVHEQNWKLVPYPAHGEEIDGAPSELTSASFASGPDAARAAWDAVADLDRRVGDSRLAERGGAVVSATLDAELTPEAYRLDVDGDAVTVTAAGGSGFRHAFVTLAQWLASGLPSRATVADAPRYVFRGLHVDLARQWFEPEVVECLIDVAAWRKLSHLHLHLTDDEAWRVPVAAFPELAVAGVRGHGLPMPPMLGGGAEPAGRAYTPDEIAAWVARADTLGIVLVPEVDLPAHVHAALTALPHLRDPDDASRAVSVQYYTDNVLVPGHSETMPFVEAVVDALAALFPSSPWIHIGGDEVPHGAWSGSPIVAAFMSEGGLSNTKDVEATFHRDVVRTIRERTGRHVAAWQEAAESGGVAPGDGYVVGWRTVAASRELAAKGYDVVVSPGQAYYLDMAVDDDWSTAGASWAGSSSLDHVCEFDPEHGWSDSERDHLLGVQACLWTETVHDEQTLYEFLFPRLDAIAERGWTGRIAGGAQSLRGRHTPARSRNDAY